LCNARNFLLRLGNFTVKNIMDDSRKLSLIVVISLDFGDSLTQIL
jgi:hypothetical protein